MHTNPT